MGKHMSQRCKIKRYYLTNSRVMEVTIMKTKTKKGIMLTLICAALFSNIIKITNITTEYEKQNMEQSTTVAGMSKILSESVSDDQEVSSISKNETPIVSTSFTQPLVEEKQELEVQEEQQEPIGPVFTETDQILYSQSPLNIRQSPDTNSEIMQVVSINTELHVIGQYDNGWSKVQLDDQCGYVATQYLASTKVTEILLGTYKITGYDACITCCGKADRITSSGTIATAGRTIAMDPAIPFGTKVRIGDHIYTVEDRGGAIIGGRIDMYFNTHSEAKNYGVKYENIYIVLE